MFTRQKSTCPSIALSVAILFLSTASLVGCAQWKYPTQAKINKQIDDVPTLNTISAGRAYLLVVRNDMIDEKVKLRRIEYGLDAGILGGAITLALGTALHWGAHSTIKAGILTGAALGVDSALSIKTQEQIINKGLDALNCVESQAETAYVAVAPRNAILELVDRDISNLRKAIDKRLAQRSEDAELSDLIDAATLDVSGAEAWLVIEAIPIATVNNGVRVGINAVLQTTVDQLNSTLPDGSAFSKISTSFHGQTAPTALATVPSQRTPISGGAKAAVVVERLQIDTNLTAAQERTLAIAKAKKELVMLASQLNSDMISAKSMLATLGTVNLIAPLPTINCPIHE